MAKTYLEAIQEQHHAIIKAYSNLEWLRDIGDGPEKDSYNKLRGQLYNVQNDFEKLEQLVIARKRHDMKI